MNISGAPFIYKNLFRLAVVLLPLFLAAGCATVDAPDGQTVQIPTATPPLGRYEGLNEKRDPVTRVKLGRDVLMPQPLKEDLLPDVKVGPYELRGETLASALQLILDDYDISLAFESNEGLTRRITVANLHGKLRDVVNRICSIADLYCHFEAGNLTIKNTETFVVDLPPIGGGAAPAAGTSSTTTSTSSAAPTTAASTTAASSGSNEAYTQIAAGLAAVIGSTPTIDTSTRIMIYTATQRSNKYALQYFERLRKNTALIIFETHIWEVSLNNENRTGINWTELFARVGNFEFSTTLLGQIPVGNAAVPVTFAPTYTGSANLTTEMVLAFIAARGNVKTISQPQIAVLSGSSASLAVSQLDNYVSGTSRTPSTVVGAQDTVTITTGTVTTGLTMNVASAWDQSTVYGNLNITLDNLIRIEPFGAGNSQVQLPHTNKRSLQTEIRVRPGDAILIGGLVSERDELSESGPGFMKPLFSTSRNANKANTELIFLLRPRVVAFVSGDDADTPPIVDAPREGVAIKRLPVPELTGRVRDMFRQAPPAPAPAPDITDNVKGLFEQKTEPVTVFPIATVTPPADAALPESMREESMPPSAPVRLIPPQKSDEGEEGR